ncbi:SDR family oxidoreductase [Hoeflea sp. Naph1]|uniref:SDR family oxidoreductase n=1 Tax=Hoeflea sp. Naph1 TaxID=3388653 RepID=UPI00398F8EED
MRITLPDDTKSSVLGESCAVATAIGNALRAQGATASINPEASDIAVAVLPLDPATQVPALTQVCAQLERIAKAMHARGGGRIVVVLSAAAAVPIRHRREYSQAMAAAYFCVRVLAMDYGAKIQVNAVGVGHVADGDDIIGDPAFLRHVPLPRTGTHDNIVNTVLFFCDPLNSYINGQLLCVDGGWSVGYGRNF